MPVDTQHPEYADALPDWTIMEDVLSGQRAIKSKGTAYLPKLNEQNDTEYAAYKQRAGFFNATGKAHEALVGFIFRRNPEVTIPENETMAGIAKDITLGGLSLYDYTRKTVEAVMAKGRMGTLVDWDEAENRPLAIAYTAEDIINWKTRRIGGMMVLSQLVLHEKDSEWIPLGPESKPEQSPDEYSHKTYDQWRVYRVDETGGDPFVICEVWRRKEKTSNGQPGEWAMVKQAIPTRRGKALHRIPFIFHNADDSQPEIGKVPLIDMATVNLSHYMTSADLENGRHFTGLPTPYAAGFEQPADGKLAIGSSVAWVTDRADAKVGFVEFSGQGLGALERAITEKETQMAALGAKMLEPEAKKAEAYDTVELRSSAETSALSKVARAVSGGISDILQWMGWWIGGQSDPEDLSATHKIELNRDFLTTRMRPEELQQMVGAYAAGAIDFETLFWNLQRGEMIEPQRTIEEVKASIEANPPGGMTDIGGGGVGGGGA